MKSFLFEEESGQGMVEYGLIIALVAVACIVGVRLLGTSVGNKLNAVSEAIDGNTTT